MPLDNVWRDGPPGSTLAFEREDGRFLDADRRIVPEEEYKRLITKPRSVPLQTPQQTALYTGNPGPLPSRSMPAMGYNTVPSTAPTEAPSLMGPASPLDLPPAKLAKVDVVADRVDDNQKALNTGQKPLYPEYTLRNNNFFYLGKIFACTWHEPEGRKGTKLSQDVTIDRFGEQIYTTIRRWIVIKNKGSTSLCVPITTYRGRGCDKDGLPPDQVAKHTAICMVEQSAEVTRTERERGMRKDTLHVIPASRKEKLQAKSRVNFGKYYHVEHNIKVREVGQVHQDDIYKLVTYFNQSVQDDLTDTQ